MEDVLDLYEEEYDLRYPTVCLDEKPVVLHADVQLPVPVASGQPERVDYEYERRGTRTLFVLVEPLAGWRHVKVTMQRTMQDYAETRAVAGVRQSIPKLSMFAWCRII